MSRICLSLGATIIVLSGSSGVAVPQAREEAASAKVWVGRAAEYEDFLKNRGVRTEKSPWA
jgi:hypothetical protein